MATNQVLLLQPIQGLGAEGDTVTVRAGYARNFLLPRKIALPITHANKKQMESLLKAREAREVQELDAARELAAKISSTTIAVAVKTGEGGKMYGAVTANDLIIRLKEEGIELVKKQLSLPAPVKDLGSHTVAVKLHSEIVAELKFEVVSENPIEVVEDDTTAEEEE
ncbi:MAG: 50S ribosomal protein L9 [Puniceicoccaceae bacterium MED-G31]|nr:50S ribosomal protein L9 [Coraliomargarita sp.]PDH28912.1 MAG: 50S ribosomal protein L9 [Puniceicoccaceae bacterium MED-G31]HBO58284.1 50S ribosomal protein L9 [Opitutae bacterium]|tara:strand:+ start:9698 stop:10198 length:501 start_codon:yes stop_codon:yes gene_type:complete